MFYPELSGVSDSVVSLSKELAKQGHFINFYVPRYSPEDYKKVGVPEKEPDFGQNIKIVRFSSIHISAGTGQGRGVIPSFWRWREVKKFRPDVIHAQLFFGVGLEALIASRRIGVPLIGTNHTAVKEFLRYSPVRSERTDRWILQYVNWYYGKCVLTTAPSQSVIDEMERYGFKGKSAVLSNPIDTNVFRPAGNKTALKKKYGLSDFCLMYAGRLAPEKNVDVIIKALALAKKSIPEAQLAIAGTGTEEQNLKHLAGSLGVEKSIKFLGFLDHAKLAEAYNASEAFVMMSTSETQGLVMMQAMACGIPVIGARARALPEYINTENGILVEPDDHKTLAEKIVFLLTNDNVRKKLGAGARESVQKFSAPAVAKEWEQIYERAIADYNRSNR